MGPGASSSTSVGLRGGSAPLGPTPAGSGVADDGDEAAPGSGFRRRPMTQESDPDAVVFPEISPDGVQPPQTYITPDPVLCAPGDQDMDGGGARAVHGCLWPPEVPAAASCEMDTPACSQVFTHVRHTHGPASSLPLVATLLFRVYKRTTFEPSLRRTKKKVGFVFYGDTLVLEYTLYFSPPLS